MTRKSSEVSGEPKACEQVHWSELRPGCASWGLLCSRPCTMNRSLVSSVLELTVHDTPVCWERETLQGTWLILAAQHWNSLPVGEKPEVGEELGPCH